MKVEETAQILALCAMYDGRTFEDPLKAAQAWHDILGHLRYDTVRKLVVEHYRHERRRLMPVDVIERGPVRPPFVHEEPPEDWGGTPEQWMAHCVSQWRSGRPYGTQPGWTE